MTILYPKTRAEWLDLRHKYVSSTDSPSLFDVGYNTRLGLYFLKLEDAPTDGEMSERMEMGLVNQRSIALYIARKYGVRIRALNGYATRPSRMGSSFDYEIIGEDLKVKDIDDDSLRLMYRDKGPGVLEIKNVDYFIFKQDWAVQDNGSYIAPPHIEIQVQHQLRCIERQWGVIGACIGGNRLELMIRNRDDYVGEIIETRVALFWDWIDKKTPPPEQMPDDFEMLKRVYGHAEPGVVMDATGKPEIERLCKVYRDAKDKIKEWELVVKSAHADLLKLVGEASKVVTTGHTISCGVSSRDGYVVEPCTYRNWRITAKKSPKEKSE